MKRLSDNIHETFSNVVRSVFNEIILYLFIEINSDKRNWLDLHQQF